MHRTGPAVSFLSAERGSVPARPVIGPTLSRWSMPEFLYIFGYETPRQRRNNASHGWDDEDSHGVLIDAPDADTALKWGDRIAQRYVAQLHGLPEVDWTVEGYASFIEEDRSQYVAHDWPRLSVGEYPNFEAWLETDRV